jgi:hypothetical protein
MKRTIIGGLAATVFACACGAPEATPGGSSGPVFLPPLQAGSPAIQAHAAPQDLPLTAAAPVAAPAPAVAPPPAAAPAPAAVTPVAATPPPVAAPAPAAVSGFDAGSGTLDADGKTVIYHIPDGTGGKDWNPKDKPIRVSHGMVLRLIDDDKSTKSGGHWLHTNGQPCSHATKAIGAGFDCKVNNNAPMGVISGTFEHNVANGIGRVYIEIVAPPAAG